MQEQRMEKFDSDKGLTEEKSVILFDEHNNQNISGWP